MEMQINRNKPLVMHIDLNSCFATITQQAFPHLRGKPLVMAAYDSPRGCVLAPSIEAKRYGIKTGMRVMEARMLCKDIIVRTTDARLIRDVHVRFSKICKDYSIITTAKSIDEIVIDFEPMENVLKRDLTEIATEIKKRIRVEIGEWISCSIGISTNRFLAKTAASLHKPDGLDVITSQNLKEIYRKMQLIDLTGINTKFQARLNVYGIFSPLQFLNAPLDVLKKQVFQSITGFYWYKRLRGWEVDDFDFMRKSFGQDYALPIHTDDPEKVAPILMKLCEKMGRRLRSSSQVARGIHVAMMYGDYTSWHRGRMGDDDLYSTMDLYKRATLIFNQQPERKLIAKLSVSCYELRTNDKSQLTLFDTGIDKQRALADAMDRINNKYGEFVITPARMMSANDLVPDRIAFGAVKEIQDLYN